MSATDDACPQPYQPYQYVVLRCLPRVEREEFLNVGVVVHCQAAEYLEIAVCLDHARLLAVDPRLDVDSLQAGLEYLTAVCRGETGRVGEAASGKLGVRFGWVKSPRSTVLQPGPVHGGLTRDPARELDRLLEQLVL